MGDIVLAVDVEADAAHLFKILTTTEGQAATWTSDCDVDHDHARFGFAQAPVDLECDVEVEPDRLARFTITSGFPFWNGSVFEWELGPAARAQSGTNVLFRHRGFEDGYPEQDRGMTAHTWALILSALKVHAETGEAAPALG
jgi:hypothetical protein